MIIVGIFEQATEILRNLQLPSGNHRRKAAKLVRRKDRNSED